MSAYTKIAITLPTATYRAIEKARKRLGKTRSAAVAAAVEDWLRRLDLAEADREYADAYRRQPEDVVDVRATTAAGLATWPAWEPGAPSRARERRPAKSRR